MSNVMRAVVTTLAAALLAPVSAERTIGAQTTEAVPRSFIGDWSWRSAGVDGATFSNVTTDTAFPYRVCGTATSGRAGCVPSRTEANAPAAPEWIDFGRTGPIAIDPLDADVVYGGAVQRFDRRTTQLQDVAPSFDDGEHAPSDTLLLFSPSDPRTLYFAGGALRKTSNGGLNWAPVSPSLPSQAITAMAISPVDSRVMWIGGDRALQVTRDAGVTWTRCEPPDTTWTATRIEASRFDPSTAYVVMSGAPADASHVLRTRDGGRTWQPLDAGVPASSRVNVIREDAQRRGLLFAATSRGVLTSVDDGDTWQSLTLNLPAEAVTDLIVRDADLVAAVANHGFWILDDVSPLRQLTPDVTRAEAFLFRPAVAWRTRDRSAGATFYYLVGDRTSGTITIEVIETVSGDVLRRFSSDDGTLAATAGLHRVRWDVRSNPIRNRGVLALPGTYQVRLSVQGRVLRQAVIVRMDPRVRTPVSDLDAQASLSKRVYAKLREVMNARTQPDVAVTDVADLDRAADALAETLDSLQQSDTRPTPALAARAAAAIDRASTLLAAGGRR